LEKDRGGENMPRVLARVRALVVGAAVAFVGVGILPALPASAAGLNWNVQVGNESFQTLSGANRFYPNDITVHPGDTVTFNFSGGHTVTFNPPPTDSLFDFLGLGGPIGSSTLATPTTFVNGAAAFGPGASAPFVVTIGANLPAGTYQYWCQLHQFMHGVIRVTNGTLPSTDVQNQQLAQAQIAADAARMAKLDARLTKQASDEEGQVRVGAGDRTVEFVKFYPSQITVRAGQQLTFVQRDLHEPHTVTFGPASGDPTNPSFGVFPSGPGNPNAFDGTSALNSGFLFHQSQYDYWRLQLTPIAAALPRTEFGVTFTTPGTYNFYCLLHGFRDPATGQVFGMSGTVTVLPKAEDD
jgi:plastocyanin